MGKGGEERGKEERTPYFLCNNTVGSIPRLFPAVGGRPKCGGGGVGGRRRGDGGGGSIFWGRV